MFNPQARSTEVSTRSLVFRYALTAAFAAHRRNVPQVPATLSTLLRARRYDSPGLLGRPGCREALSEIRARLFHAPGRDAEARTWWHEAVATAVFAARMAQLQNASGGTAFLASLLHRSGELLALKILARVELEHRMRLDSTARRDWCSTHTEELTQRLIQMWALAPAVAACVRGGANEFRHVCVDDAALYFGRLFAIELLQPELCVPGALEHAAAELGLSPGQIAQVRAESACARELIRILD
jgi:HDOD domain